METGDVVKSATVEVYLSNLGLDGKYDTDEAAAELRRQVVNFLDGSACPEWKQAIGDSVSVSVNDMDSSVRTKEVAFTIRYRATVRDDGMDDLDSWARRNAWAIVLAEDTDIDVEVDVDYDDVTEADDDPDYRVSGGDLDDRLTEVLLALRFANTRVHEVEGEVESLTAKLRVEQESLARALGATLQGSVPETNGEIADTVHSEMAGDQDHGDA